MRVLIELTPADFISLFGLGFLCSLFFLVSGILLVVTKNPNLISKKATFVEEKKFTVIYGIINIVFSLIMLTILILGLINKDLRLSVFLLLGISVITLLIIQFVLQKRFKNK